jgi:replication factor C large subunit
MMDEIVGQDKAVEELFSFLRNFRRGKGLFIHGPSGVGKSFSVRKVADELDLEVLEVNASQRRGLEELRTVLDASKQKSLFRKGKVIVIDEIDNLSERGGISEVSKIVKESFYPVVVIADDQWNPRLREVKNLCKTVEFKRLSMPSLKRILMRFTDDQEMVEVASRNAEGDARSAINNLQVPKEIMQKKRSKKNVFEVMRGIFKGEGNALSWMDKLDMDLFEFRYWLTENIHKEFKDLDEMARAYEFVSRADLFIARARKKNNYRMMYYARILLSLGVSSSGTPRHGFTVYKSPSRIGKMMRTMAIRHSKQKVSEELALLCHASRKKVEKEIFPYAKIIFGDQIFSEAMFRS